MPAFHTIKLLLCKNKSKKSESDNANYVAENTDFAAKQYGLMTKMIEDSGKFSIPNRSSTVNTSSFSWNGPPLSGSLWYIYELTGDENGKCRRKTHRSPRHCSISDQHARCGIHDKLQLRKRFAADGEQSLRKGDRAGSQITHRTL